MIIEIKEYKQMNNYCTNCGKKLNKGEFVCQHCNTPIIDLPYNYIYKSPKKKKLNKILIATMSILLSLIIIIRSTCKST